MSTVMQSSTSTPEPSPASAKEQQLTLTGIIAGVEPGIGSTKTLTIKSSKILEHARPITPEPSPTPVKKRRLSNATVLAGVDPEIDSDDLLGTPPRSSPRSVTRRKVPKNSPAKPSGSLSGTSSNSSSGRVTISIKSAYSSPSSKSSPIFGSSSPSSSHSSCTSTSTSNRALSLRERIEAKEQARLKELQGLTKRHNTLFARAAGRSTTEPVPPAVRLGLIDPDEAALLGPPKLSASSLASSSSHANNSRSTTALTKSKLSSSPRLKTSSSSSRREPSATKRQTAILMDVLKRKSLISRLPEIADSLYMLFTQAAAAQGMGSTTARTSPSKAYTPQASGELTDASSSSSTLIRSMTATPRVPVLPLSEVLTSLTRSSRTILSRVELRDSLDLLIEFVPGFLEIRKVGQGGAEWATLVFGRREGGGAGVAVSPASSEGTADIQPLGLKEVRERLQTFL
ncbi:unnamed protein product [Tilletia controversa]|uniref:DNA replication factor Cdt1 C-terminal domain-containing protein n=3 Tax=Tilletia TaxID=13289 RepID=A0A8X7MWG6_9BASI|nr:hypothetical protein CF328_g4779 [Tilletia controversa]KAE8197844.1 hypothetical protein CF336_g1961 [Tilletia laevis]KAE8258311.1 hypothetical protein A4X03_0g4419 [Tilletia caries]KAE8198166.1 hypothetical protein CF335_g4444 [Tilletia laevis]KAE8252615.1 hypothetical protein A4X06_0g2053 [Tilletia controversa]